MSTDAINNRRAYGGGELDPEHLLADPIRQLQAWIEVAARTDQLVEPTAMSLATVDTDGAPSLRTVLLRRIIDGRLLFFTNYASRKAVHLTDNDQVALLFRWAAPGRQVEVRGRVSRATDEKSDEYFASRPRGSQIGAHVSPQSQPIADREVLDRRVDQLRASFDGVAQIPRPSDWGGYAVTPSTVEFWQGRVNRLHDRFRYTRSGAGWAVERLAP